MLELDADALVSEIRKAKRLYPFGKSHLTDQEYDTLVNALVSLDPDHPVLDELDSDLSTDTHWEKVAHPYELGSLNKCNEIPEFEKWRSAQSGPVVIQEKLDGISIRLCYANGALIRAVTRGKGKEGEDIFRNVIKMHGVPQQIAFAGPLEVRGEILLRHSNFAKLPKEEEFKNPRNTASGIAKRHDGKYANYLSVISYEILNMEEVSLEFEFDVVKFLRQQGFDVVPTKIVLNVATIQSLYDSYIATERDALDYDIDGLVAKTNRWVDPGKDWRKPKNKIALKFPHQSCRGRINDIAWYMSGAHITPVAMLDPVEIGGVTVSRANLHNFELALSRNIGIGAEVEICRRNDVIPHVEHVFKPGKTITCPTSCPECGSSVAWETNADGEETKFLICEGPECPAKTVRSVMKWLKVHECRDISEKTVELLQRSGYVDNLCDYLDLANGDNDHFILALDGFGKSKLSKLKIGLQKSSNVPLVKFMASLEFRNVGERNFEKLIEAACAKHGEVDLETLLDFVSTSDMLDIEGFGPKTVKGLQKEIKDKRAWIDKISARICIQTVKVSNTSGSLSNSSFCFTGALNTIKRSEAEKLVKSLGGKISGVSKNLTYLVTNDPESGSSKNEKALKHGTKLITEEEFLEMVK